MPVCKPCSTAAVNWNRTRSGTDVIKDDQSLVFHRITHKSLRFNSVSKGRGTQISRGKSFCGFITAQSLTGLLFNVVCFSQTQIDLAEMAVKLFLWLEHKTKQNKKTFNPRHPVVACRPMCPNRNTQDTSGYKHWVFVPKQTSITRTYTQPRSCRNDSVWNNMANLDSGEILSNEKNEFKINSMGLSFSVWVIFLYYLLKWEREATIRTQSFSSCNCSAVVNSRFWQLLSHSAN